ncbi:unnamed protein product [Parajaminaea phylloscopi]
MTNRGGAGALMTTQPRPNLVTESLHSLAAASADAEGEARTEQKVNGLRNSHLETVLACCPSYPESASLSSMQTIGASSKDLSDVAQAEVQPFFEARIYPLSQTSAVQLATTSKAVAGCFERFLAAPIPDGADGYVLYRDYPEFGVSSGQPTSHNTVRSPTAGPGHIVARLATGGATEDESLLLHFLRSQQRPGGLLRDYAIQCEDEDGQFLLIEAADHLPEWIDPDNASGRLWMVDESLYLIPPSAIRGNSTSADGCGPVLQMETALEYLVAERLHQSSSQPSRAFVDAAFSRISSYPSASWTQSSQHLTTVIVPSLSVAAALSRAPWLRSRAGQAFLGRDSQDMRVAARMTKFLSPFQRGEAAPSAQSTYCIPIKLPRRLYTHLLSARLYPPKPFPQPYRDNVSSFWNAIDHLTTPSDTGAPSVVNLPQGSALSTGRRWDLGCKLTVGLEIAYHIDRERQQARSRPRQKHSIFKTEASGKEPVEPRSGPRYEQTLERLEKLGYFENELRGSQRWKALEERAFTELARGSTAQSHKASSGIVDEEIHWEGYAARTEWTDMDSLLSFPTPDGIDLLNPSDLEQLQRIEESDAWLYEVGDTMTDGVGDISSAEDEAHAKLQSFAKRMESFIEGKGDVEGALLDESASDTSDDDGDSEMQGHEDGPEERAMAQATAQDRLSRLSRQQRDKKLEELIPALRRPDFLGSSSDRDDIQTQLLDLHASVANVPQGGQMDIDPVDANVSSRRKSSTAASRHTNGRLKHDSGVRPGLSPEEMRRSVASATQELRSSHLYGHGFDGVEGFNDDADGDGSDLGVDGECETRETRRVRAQMLDIEPSDSEDDQSEEAQMDTAARYASDVRDEMQEFLTFARKELGLSADQMSEILADREAAGRSVPESASQAAASRPNRANVNVRKQQVESNAAKEQESRSAPLPSGGDFGKGLSRGFLAKKTPTAVSAKNVRFSDDVIQQPQTAREKGSSSAQKAAGFDDLMAAMDARLNEHRVSKGLPPLSKEELERGEIRAEDWSLRRPAGASLGSVWLEQERQRNSEPTSTSAVPDEQAADGPLQPVQTDTAESLLPEEEDEIAPLTARDPALLDRLLQGEVPPKPDFKETLDRISRERNSQSGSGVGGFTTPQAVDSTLFGGAPRFTELSDREPTSDVDALMRRIKSDQMPDLESDSDSDSEGDRGTGGTVDVQHNTDPSEGQTIPTVSHIGTEGGGDGREESDESDESDEEMFPTVVTDGQEDAEVVTNLLASWRAQGSAPGPVGNLVKGLGLTGQAPR